eukprot:scaffold257_cov85-Skeletonema_dohrnii-CCMP3373.AAC.7
MASSLSFDLGDPKHSCTHRPASSGGIGRGKLVKLSSIGPCTELRSDSALFIADSSNAAVLLLMMANDFSGVLIKVVVADAAVAVVNAERLGQGDLIVRG